MTAHQRAVADAMAQGMRKAEAEHDASLTVCRTCDESAHPANPNCGTCSGRGHVIGGDDIRPCPACRLRVSPFVARAMSGSLPVKETTHA